MPASNQRNRTSPQSHGRTAASTEHSSHDEGVMGAMMEEVSGYMSRGASHVGGMTRDHEGTAVLVALAAGLGVGILIGAALAPSPKPRRWSDRLAAEGIGRRFLDQVEKMIPNAISERLGG